MNDATDVDKDAAVGAVDEVVVVAVVALMIAHAAFVLALDDGVDILDQAAVASLL